MIIIIFLFLVLPVLLVWFLYRWPVKGDIKFHLMWRGAGAGLAGGAIGATTSSLVFGANGYALFGYLFWLLITVILGMAFILAIWAFQKFALRLNLPARSLVGGLIGIATSAGWLAIIGNGLNFEFNWVAKGVICMIVGTGIVSGILGGPLDRED